METNNDKKIQRGGSISREQKKLLIEIMEASEDLRKGKFHPLFSYKDSQQQWKDIEGRLNEIPGAKKDWIHWRRTWQDLKKSVKKKNTELKKHVRCTGGGPPTDVILTEEDENLLQILEVTALAGDENVAESEVVFFEQEHNYSAEEITSIENQDSLMIQETEQAGGSEPCKSNKDNGENKQKRGNKRKRSMATHRLESSQNACDKLSRIAEEKVEIKRIYYEQKIEILKENVSIGNRIATALEIMAQSLGYSQNHI